MGYSYRRRGVANYLPSQGIVLQPRLHSRFARLARWLRRSPQQRLQPFSNIGALQVPRVVGGRLPRSSCARPHQAQLAVPIGVHVIRTGARADGPRWR